MPYEMPNSRACPDFAVRANSMDYYSHSYEPRSVEGAIHHYCEI